MTVGAIFFLFAEVQEAYDHLPIFLFLVKLARYFFLTFQLLRPITFKEGGLGFNGPKLYTAFFFLSKNLQNFEKQTITSITYPGNAQPKKHNLFVSVLTFRCFFCVGFCAELPCS